jgi:hypothetical protein
MKHMKKTVLFLFLALMMMVFLSACGGAEKAAVSTTPAPEATSDAPVKVEFSFPDGAPKLNNSSAFTCTITNNEPAEKKMSVTVNAPETAFKLESGSLSWNGTVPANSQTTVVQVMLKSFHTGHWQIDASYHIDGSSGGDFATTIYVLLGMNSSEWGTTPPWQK